MGICCSWPVERIVVSQIDTSLTPVEPQELSHKQHRSWKQTIIRWNNMLHYFVIQVCLHGNDIINFKQDNYLNSGKKYKTQSET